MGEYALKPKEYRIGILLGAFIYWTFGIVDPFMLPETFRDVWFSRYVVTTPGILISFLFSYSRYFQKYARLMLMFVVITGQLGIVLMIYSAHPTEQGYFAYYAGLVTTMYWATFIFRFNRFETTIQFLVMMIMYDSVAIIFQKMLNYGIKSLEFAWFLEINFILIASGIIAIIGSYMMDNYRQKIQEESKKYLMAKEKAEESDRLKSAFLANMSHEIRTPLNSIIGFSELLSESNLDNDVRKNYIEMIEHGGDQLLRIIGDILDISKIESNQMKIVYLQVNLSKLMRNCLVSGQQFIERHQKKQLELRLVIPSEFENIMIKSDPQRITQILDNLLTNAIKNTDQGVVEFGISGITNVDGQEKIQFFAKDTGIGIEKENFELVFQRFGRVNNSRIQRGNGIGLCITKALVELLGGTIWFESEISKGTTFYFHIQLDRV